LEVAEMTPEIKLGLWVLLAFVVIAYAGCLVENHLNEPPCSGARWLMSTNQETGEETWGWWIPPTEVKAPE